MTDDYKKRLKEAADKVSNSQSAQSITTTQTPKTSTSTKTATTATNKSGTGKNTSAAIKEPKREPYSWTRDNPFSEEVDRSFFEGFYEVDWAGNDQERKKRMAQVEEALQDLRNRRAGDMLRSTKNLFQSAKDNAQSKTASRTEFHTAPSWFSPLEKTNDDVVNAGREYAKELVDGQFMRGSEMWFSTGNPSSPYSKSDLAFLKRKYEDTYNSVKQGAQVLHNAAYLADLATEYKNIEEVSPFPPLVNLAGAAFVNEYLPTFVGVADTIDVSKIVSSNKKVKEAKEQYEKLNESEYKYLINSKPYREAFVSSLNEELEKIKNTNSFGYYYDDENERFKTAAMEELLRIMYINNNYDKIKQVSK